ncbi:MAG: dipeptide epimerase [Alphaproteobacteria bacterium]
MKLTAYTDQRQLTVPFVLAREGFDEVALTCVELSEGSHIGRGEATPKPFLGRSPAGDLQELAAIRPQIESGTISNDDLLELLPAGSARNALDCALWDLRCKQEGKRIWQILGLDEPTDPVRADYTISIDTPEKMARAANTLRDYDLVKIKLNAELIDDRLAAVRHALPTAELFVDANESWTPDLLQQIIPVLTKHRVSLIEQPLPAGQDAALDTIDCPIPLAADEACKTADDLPMLVGRYQFVNIKLDKTGGLTAALHLLHAARAQQFKVMVGCMIGTSRAMAPAFVVASQADFCDLDGASMLKQDVSPPLKLGAGRAHSFAAALWG